MAKRFPRSFNPLFMVLVMVAVATAAWAASPTPTPAPAGAANTATKAAEPKLITTKSGLKYADLEVGTGAEVKTGMLVLVDYEGRLANGEKFDSSYDRREPFSFKIGAGQVIQGWEEGVIGMKVGGKRKLVIPPDLGYGEAGAPPRIPPNATLTFEVKVLKVSNGK
ncbi:MAG: peptidylprolyl isomerase FKBP-type [Acidobacteria bacterium]|nr:peptidylprolyl isomerase FKBP-type [Acidobacteriota bacterium]